MARTRRTENDSKQKVAVFAGEAVMEGTLGTCTTHDFWHGSSTEKVVWCEIAGERTPAAFLDEADGKWYADIGASYHCDCEIDVEVLVVDVV